MKPARTVIAAVTLLVVVACGGGAQATPTNPIPSGGVYAPVCVSFVILLDRIADFKALDPQTATVEDVKFAGRQMAGAYREFRAQLTNAVEGIAQLDKAQADLSAAVSELPPDSTAQAALDGLADDLATFEAALLHVNSGTACPLPTPA